MHKYIYISKKYEDIDEHGVNQELKDLFSLKEFNDTEIEIYHEMVTVFYYIAVVNSTKIIGHKN